MHLIEIVVQRKEFVILFEKIGGALGRSLRGKFNVDEIRELDFEG